MNAVPQSRRLCFEHSGMTRHPLSCVELDLLLLLPLSAGFCAFKAGRALQRPWTCVNCRQPGNCLVTRQPKRASLRGLVWLWFTTSIHKYPAVLIASNSSSVTRELFFSWYFHPSVPGLCCTWECQISHHRVICSFHLKRQYAAICHLFKHIYISHWYCYIL